MLNTILATIPTEEIFGLGLSNTVDFSKLLMRFSFHMLVILFVVRYLYYKTAHRKDYLFTFILISVMIFLMVFLLDNVKLQLGFALGLFAVFGIIRYRTDAMPIKEMTYLFIVIGLAVINALANKKISIAELVFTNIAIVAVVYALEKIFLLKNESTREIIYEKIELITPEKRPELLADLEKRTGLKINRLEIGKMNLLKDSTKIKIYFYDNNSYNDSAYDDARDDD